MVEKTSGRCCHGSLLDTNDFRSTQCAIWRGGIRGDQVLYLVATGRSRRGIRLQEANRDVVDASRPASSSRSRGDQIESFVAGSIRKTYLTLNNQDTEMMASDKTTDEAS